MLSFSEYFEERSIHSTLLYHVTSGDNLKSILSNGLIPNIHSNFEGNIEAFSGIYISKELKKLIPNALDWEIADYDNVGLVVIESRGYTQLFMDEDNIITAIPSFSGNAEASAVFNKFAERGFKEYGPLNEKISELISELKRKFHINKHQKSLLGSLILQNYPVLFFRDYFWAINEHPMFDKFLDHYGKNDMESWFRGVLDKLSKLKLPFKEAPTGVDMDSYRINKKIGYSGNPRIVGLFGFAKGQPYEKVYSRLDPDIEEDIARLCQYQIDNYQG